MSRGFPSRSALEAFPEETVHEARHRQATTFGLMEECGDEGTRDDRLVAGSLCHQGFMPREWGLLQEASQRPPGRFEGARIAPDLSVGSRRRYCRTRRLTLLALLRWSVIRTRKPALGFL